VTTLILDTEASGFLDAPNLRFWMFQLGDADGEDVEVYADYPGCRPIEEAITRIKAADRIVAHNCTGYDSHLIERFFPGLIPRSKWVDTLVYARLSDPDERDHSLSAWGKRTGTFKGDYKGNFQQIDEELVTYARQDVVAGRALWHRVKHVEEWGEAASLEMDVAWAIDAQFRNGFGFNVSAAQTLEAELRQEMADLDRKLQQAFPPIPRTHTMVPKASNSKLGYVKGVPFTKRWDEVFNPSSRIQIEQRLVALGWKPKQKTPEGRAKIDEDILSKLSLPGCDTLLRRFRVEKMLGQLSDGKNGWLKCVTKEGRIHGRVNPNGACTGRMAHSKPNVAQADKDARMRALWIPRPGWRLVGCDAEGLEARMLAHYLHRYDGGAFADKLLNGVKELGTDVHSSNAKAIQEIGWPIDREGAKTLLYALMYGAGDPKLGMTILDRLRTLGLKGKLKLPPREIGVMARRALARSMKGIDRLTADIKAAVKSKGYLRGLDGRRVRIRSEHSALNTLLQGAGAVVMKKAIQLFWELHWSTHTETWGQTAVVHDEIIFECLPEVADPLGQSFADCIAKGGDVLGVKCPLSGAYGVGDSWAAGH
jgi:DNA polymerase-1